MIGREYDFPPFTWYPGCLLLLLYLYLYSWHFRPSVRGWVHVLFWGRIG